MNDNTPDGHIFKLIAGVAGAVVSLNFVKGTWPERIVMADMDRRDAVANDWPMAVARAGACVGINHVGTTDSRYLDDAERVALIVKLIGAGHAGRILIASSATGVAFGVAGNDIPYSHVLTHFLPMLREAGVTQEQIEQILITNTAQLLSVTGEVK